MLNPEHLRAVAERTAVRMLLADSPENRAILAAVSRSRGIDENDLMREIIVLARELLKTPLVGVVTRKGA